MSYSTNHQPVLALRLPKLGVGAMTWGHRSPLAYGGADSAEEERLAFEASLAGGATLIDTAEYYGWGKSESRVGELVREREASRGRPADAGGSASDAEATPMASPQGNEAGPEFGGPARESAPIMATKFLPLPWRGAHDVPRALESSLGRMGRSSVDLYQIHFPVFWMPLRDLAARLADAVEQGKVKAVGVSNYTARQMCITHEALAKRGVPLASNQVHYSLLHRAPEANGVLAACRELGVALIAYFPIEQGVLSGKYSPDVRPGGARRLGQNFGRSRLAALGPVLRLLRDVAARHGRTPAQVALRWLIEQDGVVPIPGAKNGRQATENAGALSFALEPRDIEALSAAAPASRA